MEKGVAHYKLATVKALVDAGHVRATASAFEGALALGINDLQGMCAIILTLRAAEHYKSMRPMQTTVFGRMCTTPRPLAAMLCISN